MSQIKDPNPPERYWYVEKSRIVYEGEWYFDTEEEAKAKAAEVHGKHFPPEKDWQRWEHRPALSSKEKV